MQLYAALHLGPGFSADDSNVIRRCWVPGPLTRSGSL